METWTAATWAQIASHAALVAAHLKEIESVAPARQNVGSGASDRSRMALEGLIGSAPSDILAGLQKISACAQVTTATTVTAFQKDDIHTGSITKATIGSSVSKSRSSRTRTVESFQETGVDRIDRLRQYDRAKKREQRDKHGELFRKVLLVWPVSISSGHSMMCSLLMCSWILFYLQFSAIANVRSMRFE